MLAFFLIYAVKWTFLHFSVNANMLSKKCPKKKSHKKMSKNGLVTTLCITYNKLLAYMVIKKCPKTIDTRVSIYRHKKMSKTVKKSIKINK